MKNDAGKIKPENKKNKESDRKRMKTDAEFQVRISSLQRKHCDQTCGNQFRNQFCQAHSPPAQKRYHAPRVFLKILTMQENKRFLHYRDEYFLSTAGPPFPKKQFSNSFLMFLGERLCIKSFSTDAFGDQTLTRSQKKEKRKKMCRARVTLF